MRGGQMFVARFLRTLRAKSSFGVIQESKNGDFFETQCIVITCIFTHVYSYLYDCITGPFTVLPVVYRSLTAQTGSEFDRRRCRHL